MYIEHNIIGHGEKRRSDLPHPRMHKRGFVLRPICDIESYLIHPVLKQDMKTIRVRRLAAANDKVIIYRCVGVFWVSGDQAVAVQAYFDLCVGWQ
ncbi:MAG: hypothetical protein HC887_01690 [Desulfobacteraceae bacterium]|nr:hypothetical protein [Desulfobacteraceae bacterium]